MQVAIVTGSGIRVGKAIAEKLAAHNYHVMCHGNHSYEAAKQLANSIQENGGSAEAIQADLAEIDDVHRLGQAIVERHSEISLLVNNAGVYENCAFEDITLDAYRKMQAVNLEAPFFLSQALLPALRKAKGTIVNITDSSVVRPYGNYSHYFVSKAGLENLTKVLALELAPDIRVNGVGPGTVAFPPDFDKRRQSSITAKIPMKHIGAEEDIANAVLYLATDATFITGQVLRVDGGSSIA